MYKELLGKNVTVLVATKGDIVLEYTGTLLSESDTEIELVNASIATMIMNVQRAVFGSNINKYKEDIDKAIINKKYIISCIN